MLMDFYKIIFEKNRTCFLGRCYAGKEEIHEAGMYSDIIFLQPTDLMLEEVSVIQWKTYKTYIFRNIFIIGFVALDNLTSLNLSYHSHKMTI